MALVGVASPTAETGDVDADGEDGPVAYWNRHLVVFLAVDPEGADRFLRKNLERSKPIGDLRVYATGSLRAARIGDFVVLTEHAEVLSRLAGDSPLSEALSYHGALSKVSEGAAVIAAFDTEALAASLREPLAEAQDPSTAFLVEVFASLGQIRAWVQEDGEALAGEFSVEARTHDPDTVRPPRPGFSEFVSSSVATSWPPTQVLEGPYSEIRFTLELPEGFEDPTLDWSNERLDQEEIDPGQPGHHRFVSHRGVPVPEQSDLSLPLLDAEEDLRAYLRNEHNLDLHLDEVQRLAETIRGEATDPAVIVRNIVDWANQSLEYSVITRSPSVEEILSTRQADCTEFSQLTVALARSLGIPARPVYGIHLGLQGAILHQWSEVYLDRWYEVDSTFGVVEVPAAHIRLPGRYGGFLATAPASRFVINSLVTEEGAWVRRLEATAEFVGSETEMAVSGNRLLVDRSRDSPIVSNDGGLSFQTLPATPPEGSSRQLLGGIAGFLRIQREDGELRIYELDDLGEWRPIARPTGLPTDLPADGSLRFAEGVQGGYLALAESPTDEAEPRLFEVAPGWSSASEVQLPSADKSRWTLAPSGGVLAQSVEGRGIFLHQRQPGVWEPPRFLDDTLGHDVIAIQATGSIIEVLVADSRYERSDPFLIRVTVDGQSKRRVAGSRPNRVISNAEGQRWSLWHEDSGTFLAFWGRWQ
ncbi:MAG: hypothetical protein K8J08_02795 [Thermoanaerobaculia bacterium]|nr:hypothetical protein [Thermoanaerobaculia bacterium]